MCRSRYHCGVISLTGVGARFSVLLLDVAAHSHLLALVFAMFISILLGMGMPTTAAYAVAASVVAPGLVQLGIEPLTAHFFVFYLPWCLPSRRRLRWRLMLRPVFPAPMPCLPR